MGIGGGIHTHHPRRPRKNECRHAERNIRRGSQLLHTRLRLAHHILNLCERYRRAHGSAVCRVYRRQSGHPQQRRLRLRHRRHLRGRGFARSAVHTLRPQHHGWTHQHHDPLAAALSGMAFQPHRRHRHKIARWSWMVWQAASRHGPFGRRLHGMAARFLHQQIQWREARQGTQRKSAP